MRFMVVPYPYDRLDAGALSQVIRAESGTAVRSQRTTAQVVDEIGAYAEAGVEWMTVWVAWQTARDLIDAMEAFTADIARHFPDAPGRRARPRRWTGPDPAAVVQRGTYN
jgi:hypothetical protein